MVRFQFRRNVENSALLLLRGHLWLGVLVPAGLVWLYRISRRLMPNPFVNISSSSSCRAASMDIPDPLSQLLPIIHRFWQVFRATSRILTYLLCVCSSWSSCFCLAICGVHRSTSLMSSSLLLQQCPACLVRLTCIVIVMGGKWPYSWCIVGCCRQDLLNRSISNNSV